MSPVRPSLRSRASTRGHGRDSLLGAGSNLAVYALSLLTGPLLARALGPAGRGDLAAVLTPTQLWVWLTAFGIPGATAYYATTRDRRELINSAWLVTLVVNVPLAVAVWVLAPHYLHGHDPVTVSWLRAIVSVGVFALPAFSALNHLNGSGRSVPFHVLRQLAPLGYALGVLVLAAAGALTLRSALAVSFATTVAGYGASLLVGRGLPSRRFQRATTAAQLRFGSRLAIGMSASLAVGRLDQLVMVRLVASAELGFYAVAATAASAGGALSQGLALALFPRIRQATSGRQRRRETRRAVRWVLIGSVSMAAAIALSAPFVVPALFGDGFRTAVPALWILLPGQVASDLTTVAGTALQARGEPGLATRAQLLAAALTIVAIVPAVHRFGIGGAAAVTSTSQFAALAYLWARGFRGRSWNDAAAL